MENRKVKTGSIWGLIPVGERDNIKKGCGRVNVVEILCAHV
jgi:hypothetical protein